MKGIIFDIQKYCIHDGPGIRTVIFLKGCPLRCLWCANPESQHPTPEFAFFKEKCIGDGACVKSCGVKALRFGKNGPVRDADRCSFCRSCECVCYANAIQYYGEEMETEAVVEECVKDRDFYEKSGGGVTLSGGEPFFQYEAAMELLESFHKRRIHTAVETTGFYSRERLEKALPFVDLFLYDIKVIDPDKHICFTGASNRSILENIKYLSASGKKLVIRIPVIPGYNDSISDIQQMISFIEGLPNRHDIHLLPYHRLGAFKYDALGRKYSLKDLLPPKREEMERIRKQFEKHCLQTHIGG